MKHPNDTPCNTPLDTFQGIDKQVIQQNYMSHDTPMTRLNDTQRDNLDTSHVTPKKQPKKRGLLGRVMDAVFSEDK